MDEANQSDETTRTQALKDLYARKKESAQEKAAVADEKTGTFKLVTDRESQLNPDLAHDSQKSIAKRMFKVEDLANSGREWRSPAFDLLDPQHPAVTGQHHPEAVRNAGSANKETSAIAAARGEIPHSTNTRGTSTGTLGTSTGSYATGTTLGTATGAGYGTGATTGPYSTGTNTGYASGPTSGTYPIGTTTSTTAGGVGTAPASYTGGFAATESQAGNYLKKEDVRYTKDS